jgi:transposase-like protein
MKHTPGLPTIILALLLTVTLLFLVGSGQLPMMWGEHLAPPIRVRQAFNRRKNRQRWLRRWAKRQRQQPQVRRARRRPRRAEVCRGLQCTVPGAVLAYRPWPAAAVGDAPRESPSTARRRRKKASRPVPQTDEGTDSLGELRQMRGLVDLTPEGELWAMLRQVRWPQGAVCPRCGEQDPRYVRLLDEDYRQGMGRWRCRVCAEAGDPGEGGTFTPLTGTLLEGMRFDIRSLWFMAEMFAAGKASVETSKEARVNRHTSDRLFRLFRAAIYQTRSMEPIALGPEDVAEFDEVYITAGLKGGAGGLTLEREARPRGLKRRGRGDWDSDRLPVFGLLCRGGQVRLFVLRNVQTETIRPIVEQMVKRGARVYTDGYCIYHVLSEAGYQHHTVNHSAGQYALDLDGHGQCEVHCNTMECTWSWLRQMVRTYRGVSKVYLPLYVAQFEFFYNRRHQNRWNRTLDVLQAVFQVDATSAADLRTRVQTAQLAEVCPVAG